MIGTIRKHSKWLLWVIAAVTIASFVFFMGSGPARQGGGGGYASIDTNIIGGAIYGQKVTPERYAAMEHDTYLYYLFNYGTWPNRDPNVTKDQLMQEIYIRMMMVQKAKEIGIHVSDEQVQRVAATELGAPQLLRALGIPHDQTIPLSKFVSDVLGPEGLDAADYESYIRDDLAIEQLQLIYGLPGLLVTPQEAEREYIREYQEMSAQIVFFSASNYLSQAAVTPEQVGLFYTNYMANYRLPDRVQVSYVEFSVSNYLASAEQELMKSNLDAQVAYFFGQYGMQAAPDAKSPDEAKAEIRKAFIRRYALSKAGDQANDFAQAVFNVNPASPQNLATVARQKGLQVHSTAPFSAEYGPEEFTASPSFTRAAFELTPDSPISEPVAGSDGVYIIALNGQFPSEIPSLDRIRGQVTQDLRLLEATQLAQRAGTNFSRMLVYQMASGKSFASATLAAGYEPQVLPPLAMSTQEMPELDGRATLNQLKEAAFTTSVGMASGFKSTDDGGFVLYIESKQPIDESKMAADMPEFTDRLRQQSQVQAFRDWYLREANRELRDTPAYHTGK